MQIWFRGCAVFATLKIPAPFRKTTSVLVHSLLFFSEKTLCRTSSRGIVHPFKDRGGKNVTCLAATLVHIVQGQIRRYPPSSTQALICLHGPTLQ